MSGTAMVVLGNDFGLWVTSTFLDGVPGGTVDPGRLTNQFEDRRARPMIVPRIVAKKMPNTDTNRVFTRPTRNA